MRLPAFLLLASLACAAVAQQSVQVPDEARLRERVAAVHAAIGANDVETWYAALPPSSRRRLTLDDFKRDIRWDSVGAKSPPASWTAQVARICNCTAARCVVSVQVDMESPGKPPVVDLPLETWDREGGEWYLAYIGASTGGRCPGERSAPQNLPNSR